MIFQPGIRKTLSHHPRAGPCRRRDPRHPKAKVEYLTDAQQKAKIGMLADLSEAAEHADVLERESALVAGQADLRFTGLITVTAATLDELQSVVAEVTSAAVAPGVRPGASAGSRPERSPLPPSLSPAGSADEQALGVLRTSRSGRRVRWRSSRAQPQQVGVRSRTQAPQGAPPQWCREAASAAPMRAARTGSFDCPRTEAPLTSSLAPTRSSPRPDLGSHGVFIGQDAWSGGGFCYDPWTLYAEGTLTNPNALLAGVVGKGKSCLAKSIATRSIAFGRRVYVPGDPKGEWTSVSLAVGGAAIRLGPGTGHRLNPLDPGPPSSGLNRGRVAYESSPDADGRCSAPSRKPHWADPSRSLEHTALDAALAAAVDGSVVPTLPLVVDSAHPTRRRHPRRDTEPSSRRDGRDLAHALRRLVAGDLAGLFDGPSTVAFDPSLPMVSLDMSAIAGLRRARGDGDDLRIGLDGGRAHRVRPPGNAG